MLKILPRSHLFLIGKTFSCSTAQFLRHKSDNEKVPLKSEDELNIDLNELNQKLEESLNESKSGKITEVDKTFMNFSAQRNVIKILI